MIQNPRIPRFASFAQRLFLSISAAVITIAASAPATSQVVSRDAFNESPDHSILEFADDSADSSERVQASFSNPNTNAALRSEASSSFEDSTRITSTPPTNVSPSNTNYDAPLAPRPRLKGASPLSAYNRQSGSETSGTFASQNEPSAPIQTTQLQPQTNRGVNNLRSSGLRPAPEEQDQESPFPTSTGSFSSTPASVSSAYQSSTKSTTVVSDVAGSNSTAKIDVSTESFSGISKPKYESAYLHDQKPQRKTPKADAFSSSGVQRLATPKQLSSASMVDDTNAANTIQQTAFLSPASPAAPQSFQNNQFDQQQNQPNQFRQQAQPGQQRQTGQQSQRGQQGRRGQQQGQRTRQQNLPRQTQNQSSNQTASKSSDSSSAKAAIAKFAFDANQQSANGLPIRLMDLMQQSEGRASRTQLIPQYWETYYDWAQPSAPQIIAIGFPPSKQPNKQTVQRLKLQNQMQRTQSNSVQFNLVSHKLK